jgi:Ca-activated chloride channel family protein
MHELGIRSLSVNVNLVLVPVSVIDSLHRPVVGLDKDNFELYEGDVAQPIRYFYQEDSPLSVALVLDFSGSMAKRIDLLREAVDQFFANANPLDDYTVISVSDRPEVLVRASRSIQEIQATLATVKPAGWTALLDSVRVAAMALRTARQQRKVILIVSDGLDNVSRHNIKDVASMVEESDLDAFAIGVMDDALPFFSALAERVNKKLLKRLTDVTGGRTVIAEHVSDLPEMATKLSQEMRSEYVLGYRPLDGAHERKWRKLKVKVSSAKGELRAYYRKAYFTPGD